jgi:indolepyruvate ferredoxin oxidoreductase beta subunit
MQEKNFNILMVGVGGQGIITASDILTLAALQTGFDVKKSEIHGMSQRGGSVTSHVRFGKKIYSPLISKGEADILLSLEEMETLRWIEYAGKKSTVIVLKNQIKPAMSKEYPQGIEQELKKICPLLLLVDLSELGRQLGAAKFLNVALLGLMAPLLAIPGQAWKEAISATVPEDFLEKNLEAFEQGRQYYHSLAKEANS